MSKTQLLFPDIGGADYLIAIFDVLGKCEYSAPVAKQISWESIKAWSDLTGVKLSNLEMKFLREMSFAFASGLHEFIGQSVPAPFQTHDESKSVADKIRDSFRALKND